MISLLAGLAQSHRHRTINYTVQPQKGKPSFFVPPILQKESLKRDWDYDIKSVADVFPQGMLVKVNERGMYEDFISKAAERLCGNAQWEIMNQTKKTLDLFLEATKNSHLEVFEALKSYAGPRCSHPNYTCANHCAFGPSKGIERLV